MEEIKKDIKIIKEDVGELKVDVSNLSERIDSLAVSTKNGFDEVYEELRDHRELTVKIIEKMELMHDDIKDMKRGFGGLVKSQASTDRITTDHEGRLTKIEGHLELV